MPRDQPKTRTKQTVTASWHRGCLAVEVTTKAIGAQLMTYTTTSYVHASKRDILRALRRAEKP